jgi:hypothetical protein
MMQVRVAPHGRAIGVRRYGDGPGDFCKATAGKVSDWTSVPRMKPEAPKYIFSARYGSKHQIVPTVQIADNSRTPFVD